MTLGILHLAPRVTLQNGGLVSSIKKSHEGRRSTSSPEKRSKSKGPAKIWQWDNMDFLNLDVIAEPLYLYPTRGLTLPKHLGSSDERGQSIILNNRFTWKWLSFSLPSTDDVGYLHSTVELHKAKVGPIVRKL